MPKKNDFTAKRLRAKTMSKNTRNDQGWFPGQKWKKNDETMVHSFWGTCTYWRNSCSLEMSRRLRSCISRHCLPTRNLIFSLRKFTFFQLWHVQFFSKNYPTNLRDFNLLWIWIWPFSHHQWTHHRDGLQFSLIFPAPAKFHCNQQNKHNHHPSASHRDSLVHSPCAKVTAV